MKRSSLKRHSSNSISVLKRHADKAFSDFIRDREKKCYTCGRLLAFEKRQAGHFISRTHSNTRYDPMNVHVQCGPCNIWRYGQPHEFAAHLIEEYGLEEFNELVKRGRQHKQFIRKELEGIVDIYSKEK